MRNIRSFKNLTYFTNILFTGLIPHQYKRCRYILLNKILNKKIIMPLMRAKEIQIIEEVLQNLQPKKCLEWGAGYSTIYFPNLLDKKAKWISVEHDKDWATEIRNLNLNPSIKILCIKPNHFPWTDKNRDGSYSDFKNYIEFPSKFGKFDFILIDGRARKYCLEKAYELITNGGLVILHDANRKYYHNPFKLYKYHVLFQDSRKDVGGLWLGSKKDNIITVLNVNKHRILWMFYENLDKFLTVIKIDSKTKTQKNSFFSG